MERWKWVSQHPWWEQLQDEGEVVRVDVSRLPVTTSIQTLKQCCYCGKDANKSILEQQTCLLQVYMTKLNRWMPRENELACVTEGMIDMTFFKRNFPMIITEISGAQLTLPSQRIC